LNTETLPLSEKEFRQFQSMIYQAAGINLSETKKSLVSGRLAKRIRQQRLGSYGEYFQMLMRERDEFQVAVDLLTTNETYFFREEKHFDFLQDSILPQIRSQASIRIWSGACSSGEEPYSIAILLSETLGQRAWEVVGSDISTRVLEQAKAGQYTMEEVEDVPKDLLFKYFLKGIGSQEGRVLVDPTVRNRVNFLHVNLNDTVPKLGDFDVIFLRNVMIYFDVETKRKVLRRVLPMLRPGGYFFISHSESLNGITDAVRLIKPSIYQKPK
jgi:chemotaxis protein methyltransferase CheR